jgi:hypothetical protein
LVGSGRERQLRGVDLSLQSSEQSAGRAHPLSSENEPILMREEAGAI